MARLTKRQLYYRLPPGLRYWARQLYYLPGDLFSREHSEQGIRVPPKGMIYTGGGPFLQEGRRIVELSIREGGLQPDATVLDIGSGIGRIALPLSEYLGAGAVYEGFDVVEKGVRWCQKHIQRRFPNFHFQYVPLKNDLYRSDGKAAADFTFPYPSAHFDFALVNSVFTHMVPAEVGQYLKELGRVLKPGGICYATFFVYDAALEVKLPDIAGFSFPHDYEDYRLMDRKVTAANVAFRSSFLKELIEAAGLQIRSMHPGYWSGRPEGQCEGFQDTYFLERRNG